MNKKINYGVFASIILAIILVISLGVNSATIGDLEDNIGEKDIVIAEKDVNIANIAIEVSTLNQKLLEIQTVTTEAEAEVEAESLISMYLLDGYSIGVLNTETLSDRELSLFDGEVEYDDEDYDADEYVLIAGEFVVNEDDMNANVYMAFEEGDIEYQFVFEDDFNFNGEDSLKFNFLGEEIEVTEWSDDSITVKMADEMIIAEGETVSVDDNTILLDMVMDDAIYVTVNGESEKIDEDDCEKVADVEICVSDVLYSEKSTIVSRAVVSIASDVEEEIDSGDQYGDSEWSWNIDYETKTIGLVLSEEFKDLDEDYMPLSVGDSISLPNEYMTIEFVGLSEEDMSEIDFDFDLSDDETTITGEFEDGMNDLDELIVNSSGMYYEDDDDNMIEVSSVNLKNSDVELSYASDVITLGDVKMPRELNTVDFGLGSENDEGTYRSIYGSIVELSDDLESDEDNELSVSVPEEELEISFLMY